MEKWKLRWSSFWIFGCYVMLWGISHNIFILCTYCGTIYLSRSSLKIDACTSPQSWLHTPFLILTPTPTHTLTHTALHIRGQLNNQYGSWMEGFPGMPHPPFGLIHLLLPMQTVLAGRRFSISYAFYPLISAVPLCGIVWGTNCV